MTVDGWVRKSPLTGWGEPSRAEIWEYVEGGRTMASFEITVRVGKTLDVVGFKGASLQGMRDYAAFLRTTAADLYGSGRPRRQIVACPCCDADTARAAVACAVFGVSYRRCGSCGHVFVGEQPTSAALEGVFAKSEPHASAYTDRATAETRLADVVEPKREWARGVFRARRGRDVGRVVDVGAGGGHFVESCRRAGIAAVGYEVNEACRRFAREIFGLDLVDEDFLVASDGGEATVDLITFWGLLEYTPEPKRYLEAARRRLPRGDGMLVVEVPRFDCVGSAIQMECPETVARHLDPTSHMNCFTDASLATALFRSGFQPVAAWYFGMDAYELLVQLGLDLDRSDALTRVGSVIPGLQAAFDSGYLCDDLIVAAVPSE